MNDSLSYDVVILGSGFGGSLMGAILGRAGLSVAIVDRERHPRFAIGESSTPAADLILHNLAKRHHLPELLPLTRFGSWREAYPNLLCGCKRGFSYFWHGEADDFKPSGDHKSELFVAANASREVADTQWYRPHVDQFLANVARNHSAELFEAATLLAIDHPEPHAWKLQLDTGDGTRTLQTEFVIDATGPAGVLMRHLNLRDISSLLKTNSSAVYGHWIDVPLFHDWLARNGAVTADYPFSCDDSAIHHLFPDGWAWQLRFENGLTSLGSVFASEFPGDAALNSEQLLTQNRPALARMLASAKQAASPGRLFRTGRMQRLWNLAAGRDWAALPSTAGFIDPLHSTGIAHTLHGIDRLCEILISNSGKDQIQALEDYSTQCLQELLLIDLLVSGCYLGLNDFRLFTTWSMLYFAAATCYEKQRLRNAGHHAGFLLADDSAFVNLIGAMYQSLKDLTAPGQKLTDQPVQEFQNRVKVALAPYNHVGLFAAEIPNMYRYTAAAKR